MPRFPKTALALPPLDEEPSPPDFPVPPLAAIPPVRPENATAADNSGYLHTQLITYLGNKRGVLGFIREGFSAAQREIGKDKIAVLDLFSGTGVVARMAKSCASRIVANDLELYSRIANACYLTNRSEISLREMDVHLERLRDFIRDNLAPGFLTGLYAPSREDVIQKEDRVFYTRRNAMYLDTACRAITLLPEEWRTYFLGPLLSQASMHVNTSGVFKGFYKNGKGVGQFGGAARNALPRILKDIALALPVLSRFECPYEVFQEDANTLIRGLDEVDVAYFDPPYNQHPYGSNYFMLNLLCDYRRPEDCSPVSGIPKTWNRSDYNKRGKAQAALFDAIENCRAKCVLVSYNSEGFVPYNSFVAEMEKVGRVQVMDTQYNTFRGCRNLGDRDPHVTEYLYLIDKR